MADEELEFDSIKAAEEHVSEMRPPSREKLGRFFALGAAEEYLYEAKAGGGVVRRSREALDSVGLTLNEDGDEVQIPADESEFGKTTIIRAGRDYHDNHPILYIKTPGDDEERRALFYAQRSPEGKHVLMKAAIVDKKETLVLDTIKGGWDIGDAQTSEEIIDRYLPPWHDIRGQAARKARPITVHRTQEQRDKEEYERRQAKILERMGLIVNDELDKVIIPAELSESRTEITIEVKSPADTSHRNPFLEVQVEGEEGKPQQVYAFGYVHPDTGEYAILHASTGNTYTDKLSIRLGPNSGEFRRKRFTGPASTSDEVLHGVLGNAYGRWEKAAQEDHLHLTYMPQRKKRR